MGLFTERDEETPNQIIIGKLNRIEAKLDAVIKAMHDYDGNDEYGESSFEAFMDDEEAANKRMDIIGQNGNEGSHYVTNEEADEDAFDDYGQRVVGDRDKDNNTQNKRRGGKKNKRKVDPIVQHQQFRQPHKH
jgi:hypothetical protein